jgi:hypothetical protein
MERINAMLHCLRFCSHSNRNSSFCEAVDSRSPVTPSPTGMNKSEPILGCADFLTLKHTHHKLSSVVQVSTWRSSSSASLGYTLRLA